MKHSIGKISRRWTPQFLNPRKTWLFVHHFAAPQTASAEDCGRSISSSDKIRHLEAVLFLSPQGINSRRAAKVAGLADATEVRTLIRQLNLLYDEGAKPYRVEEVAGGYAILTRPQFAPWLRKLAYVPGEMRLGQSALETLAIVAYRQPVTRADVEAIRGVSCSDILKQLMELDLVRISGRSEDLGRPYLYGTSQRFLQMFGLRSADRLPRIEWVNQPQPAELSSTEDLAAESEVKESTVKKSITATALLTEEIVDERMLAPLNSPIVATDDDDEFYDDDEDEEEDDDEDYEEDEDWEDDDEAEEGDEEEVDAEEEEGEEWEEVDDEDEEADDEEEDEDDWDDDEEDDDWDDEEEEEDEDWE